MDLFFDNEFRALVPPLQPEELQGLEESLKREGNREPIIIWRETKLLLDGHNRYNICHNNNIELKPPLELSFPDREAAQVWIIQNQFSRRNINNYQRSVLALKLESIFSAKAKVNQKLTEGRGKKGLLKSANLLNTRQELAKIAHVGLDTIAKVKRIEEKATTEQKKKLRIGDISINEVFRDIKKREDFDNNQIELINLMQKAQSLPSNDKFQIFIGDFNLICSNNEIAPNSIDAIITDPPWTKETMNTYSQLSKVASRILKPNGIVMAMVGQAFMPEAIERMSEYLKFWWTIAYMLPGVHERAWAYKTINQWKPILFFVKDSYKGGWIFDVVYSEQREKRFHAWQSSDSGMKALIENVTKPNDLILDPFMGSGATGIAALELNRRFLGIELSEETAMLARARMSGIDNVK